MAEHDAAWGYAVVSWYVGDLDEYDITQEQKEKCLAQMESDLQGVLIARGLVFIDDWMIQHGYRRKEVR